LGFVLGTALTLAACGTILPEDTSVQGRHLAPSDITPAAVGEIPGIVTPAPL